MCSPLLWVFLYFNIIRADLQELFMGIFVGKSADFPTFYFLSSADGAQEAFPARPLVNHPRQRGTVASDMVPLWNPLLPPTGGNGDKWIDRGSWAKASVSITSAEQSFHNGKAESVRYSVGVGDGVWYSTWVMNCIALIPISPLHLPAGVFRVSAAPENRVNDFLRL